MSMANIPQRYGVINLSGKCKKLLKVAFISRYGMGKKSSVFQTAGIVKN